MTNAEAEAIRDAAVALRDNLVADLNNTASRGEYIRLSQLAHEADRLVQALDIIGADR